MCRKKEENWIQICLVLKYLYLSICTNLHIYNYISIIVLLYYNLYRCILFIFWVYVFPKEKLNQLKQKEFPGRIFKSFCQDIPQYTPPSLYYMWRWWYNPTEVVDKDIPHYSPSLHYSREDDGATLQKLS